MSKMHTVACDCKVLAPHSLKRGDTICVISPSSSSTERIRMFQERISYIVENLKIRGFKVVVETESLRNSKLELGDGTEQLRANLFNKAIKDLDIKAIFSIWGGYGSTHILDKIDYKAFRKNRKIFVGYSDETAIELAILKRSGVVTFHGPMVGATMHWQETDCFDNLFDMLMNLKPRTELRNIDDHTPFKVFKPGFCEAQVLGGNMCLILSLMSTPYEPCFKNKILFIEEIEEAEYRIHRMLWQLKLAGRLDELSGIIIGSLVPIKGESEERLLKVCFDVVKDLKIPIIYNFHAGHLRNPLTLPIGATLRISNERITISQSVVAKI